MLVCVHVHVHVFAFWLLSRKCLGGCWMLELEVELRGVV